MNTNDTVNLLREALQAALSQLKSLQCSFKPGTVGHSETQSVCNYIDQALAAPVAATQPAGNGRAPANWGLGFMQKVWEERAIHAASAPAQPEAKGEALARAEGPSEAEQIQLWKDAHGYGNQTTLGVFNDLYKRTPSYRNPDAAPVPAAPADTNDFTKHPMWPEFLAYKRQFAPGKSDFLPLPDPVCIAPATGAHFTAEQMHAYGQACILADRARQAADMDRMRSAFHVNMLRAYPGKSHEEIASEIDKACGQAAIAQPSGAEIATDKRICELEAELRKAKESAKYANDDADMYANAWQRELCAYDGKVYNKRHHIDAMVKTTQEFIKSWKASEARVRELESSLAAAPQPSSTGIADDKEFLRLFHEVCDESILKNEDKAIAAMIAYIDTRTAALIDAASKERGGDAEARQRNLELVISRLEQIAGNFSVDYREDAEQALVCARAIATTKAAQ